MTARDLSFSLIGFGIGLIFSTVELVLWFRHMFIVRFNWSPALLYIALPIAPILLGILLLSRGRQAPSR